MRVCVHSGGTRMHCMNKHRCKASGTHSERISHMPGVSLGIRLNSQRRGVNADATPGKWGVGSEATDDVARGETRVEIYEAFFGSNAASMLGKAPV